MYQRTHLGDFKETVIRPSYATVEEKEENQTEQASIWEWARPIDQRSLLEYS